MINLTSWLTYIQCTQWSRKTYHFYFCDNFGKCGPILITLTLLYSEINYTKKLE